MLFRFTAVRRLFPDSITAHCPFLTKQLFHCITASSFMQVLLKLDFQKILIFKKSDFWKKLVFRKI
jgi:hypothetical protein